MPDITRIGVFMADRRARTRMTQRAEATPQSFGVVLRSLRRDAGLSQEALAERANISWRTISDLERGIKRKPQQETRRLLADALGLSPDDRAQFDAAARGERNVTLSIVAVPPPPASDLLPVPLAPLLGRTDEIDALCARLRTEEVRLITVTGPGGVGKTRVALAVAAAMCDEISDGVWFVPLAAIRDPALTAPTIAHAIGLEERSGQAIEDALRQRLRNSSGLLVLDNFEQIATAGGIVSGMLTACPHLRILVTSRSALRVYGEHEYPLGPLPVPDPASDARIIAQSPAVELFRQRATAIRPSFAISPLNAASVAAICARLDGLPLAIELVAARTRLFSPADILARLVGGRDDARLALLTDGARDAPTRQRTMREAIAWSYELLTEDEQTLFASLSVFVGGWTLDAAIAVCHPDNPQAIEDGIAALIDHSMIRTSERGTGEVRFAMLETIREFGWQHLTAHADRDVIEDRHCAWFTALAERTGDALDGPAQVTAVGRLIEEYDNLRAALATARARNDTSRGLRLAVALAPFWERYGYYAEGCAWLDLFLQHTDDAAAVAPALVVRALNAAGMLAAEQGDTTRAAALLAEAQARALTLGDETELATALKHLGHIAEIRGEFDLAIEHLGDAIARHRRLGDERGVAAGLIALGTTQRRLGAYTAARMTYEESLSLHRQRGNQRGVAQSLFNLGTVAYHFNELPRATLLLGQSLAIYQEMEEKPGIGACLGNLGLVAWKQHEFSRSLALQEQALAVWRKIGDKRATANALNNIGLILHRQGDLDRAEEIHAESLGLRREIGDLWGITMSLNNLGTVAAARGDRGRGIALCEEGLALRRQHGHRQGVAESTYHLAIIVLDDGDPARAGALLRESLGIYSAMRAPAHTAACLIALGGLAGTRGNDATAIRLCAAGDALYTSVATPMRPEARAAADRTLATARSHMDDATFGIAWETGRSMPLDNAVEEALAVDVGT
jgi:predicted ATPase/transcriptional regulator with XRE-family HTH domain